VSLVRKISDVASSVYAKAGAALAAVLIYAACAGSTYAQVTLPAGITTTALEDTGEATMTRFLSYFVIGIGFLVAIGLTVGLTMWLVGIFGAKRKGVRG